MTAAEWQHITDRLRRLTRGRFVLEEKQHEEWYEMLADFDVGDMRRGVDAWVKASPHPPAIAELTDAATVSRRERLDALAKHEAEQRDPEKGCERLAPARLLAWSSVVNDILYRGLRPENGWDDNVTRSCTYDERMWMTDLVNHRELAITEGREEARLWLKDEMRKSA